MSDEKHSDDQVGEDKVDRNAAFKEAVRELVEEAAQKHIRTVPRKYADSPEILGSYVRDEVTGFEGIAVGHTRQITGCNRVTIQPTMKQDSSRGIPDSYAVDESHVIIIEQSQAASPPIEASEQRGGPPSQGIPL